MDISEFQTFKITMIIDKIKMFHVIDEREEITSFKLKDICFQIYQYFGLFSKKTSQKLFKISVLTWEDLDEENFF